MPLLLRLSLRALLGLALAVPASAQVPDLPNDVEGLLAYIKREKESAHYDAFYRIGRKGTPEALEASKKATEFVKRGGIVSSAYTAFQFYRNKGAVQADAIAFLYETAQGHKRDEHQRAAANALTQFGASAAAELEDLVRRHKDDAIRRTALHPILEQLLRQDAEEAVELVLELANPGDSRHDAGLRRGLKHVQSPDTVELLIKKLGDRSTGHNWRVLLVDHLATIESEPVTDLLLELLEHDDAGLALRAVEALGARGELSAEKSLWKLLKAKDPTLKRAAIVSLGEMMGADEKWVRRLFDLADDKDPVARMGAAVALGMLRTPDAVEALHALLEDEDRRVRIEAVQQAGNLRRKDSIPILIGRLQDEKGRIQQDITSVLRLVTGVDQGTSHTRWNNWWKGEGDAFEVPPYDVALAAELERRERRDSNLTIASFYGLNVVSDRVAFVLDFSGSMNTPAREEPGRTNSGDGSGSTRLRVAQRELSKALTAFPDGDLFNVVFFESGVSEWKTELVEMKKKVREDAIAFVNSKNPAGGTNVHGGLMAAFEDERVDTIYLLTDGNPTAGAITDPGRLRAEIDRLNSTRKVQIHCISVGKSSALLRGLAEDSSGQYREVGTGR